MKEELPIQKLSIIGTGNVAHHFALAFYRAGFSIHEIYGRRKSEAQQLSELVEASYTTQLSELQHDTDLILLAISDDALPEVIQQIGHPQIPLVHTSGSTPISVLDQPQRKQFGIFYPVQSLSKHETGKVNSVPICIEANNTTTETLLLSLAHSISSEVQVMDSEKRKTLHMAAVFANNFGNHLFHIADEILRAKDIPFDVIRPLLEKTVEKTKNKRPIEAQTGPAVRNDQIIIEQHLQDLKQHPTYQEMYRLFTESILHHQKNH